MDAGVNILCSKAQLRDSAQKSRGCDLYYQQLFGTQF